MRAKWLKSAPFILLSVVASAQQNPRPMATRPNLPVIDDKACPGRGRIVPNWKIKRDAPLYSSWQEGRTQIAMLKAGEKVTVISGVHVTREPDEIVVTKPIPALHRNPGDIILRYETLDEGNANFWTKGLWYQNESLATTIETDGAGCGGIAECDSKVLKNGIVERWVQVRNRIGKPGWALDFTVTHGSFKDSGNLDSLCAG
jgi:hypothetical protein